MLTLDLSSRINLTSIFVVGKYRLRASVLEFFPNRYVTLFTISSHPDIGIYKFDFDSTLNIMLNRFLKLFCGIKYQHYSYNKADLLREDFSIGGLYIYTREKVVYHGLSCGIGLGFNVMLVQNLYLLWNVSGLIQKPIMMRRRSEYLLFASGIFPIKERLIPEYYAAGANTSLSFAYVIDPLSTTISLGFRYQY